MGTMTFLNHPSAFMPVVMSLAALAIVLVALVTHGSRLSRHPCAWTVPGSGCRSH